MSNNCKIGNTYQNCPISEKRAWLNRPMPTAVFGMSDGKPKTYERFLNGEIPLVEHLLYLITLR